MQSKKINSNILILYLNGIILPNKIKKITKTGFTVCENKMMEIADIKLEINTIGL